MKAASTALKNFMATADQAWMPNLYTLTLVGGTVYRWTDKDVTVSVPGGQTFTVGPPIDDAGYQQKVGLEAGTVDVTFYADGTYTIGGVPMTQFIETGGLMGAALMIERGFATDPGSALVGTYQRFSGRFSQIADLTDLYATCTFADWREILDVNMPPHVYQPSCRHVFGDSRCTINLATYAVNGSVAAGTRTTTSFPTGLTQADNYFALGKVLFTSGANNGLWRTVKSYANASGLVTLVLPLPSAPAVSDTFTIYPGCDLTSGTCAAKFSNLIHFGGEPYIPTPETPY